jgi:hypothetical protein
MTDRELAESVVMALGALRQLVPHVSQNMQELVRVEERVRETKDSLLRLNRTVFEGNGQPSMMHQIVILHDATRTIESAVMALTTKIESLRRDDAEMVKMRSQNRTSVIVAIIALVGTVIACILTLLIRR